MLEYFYTEKGSIIVINQFELLFTHWVSISFPGAHCSIALLHPKACSFILACWGVRVNWQHLESLQQDQQDIHVNAFFSLTAGSTGSQFYICLYTFTPLLYHCQSVAPQYLQIFHTWCLICVLLTILFSSLPLKSDLVLHLSSWLLVGIAMGLQCLACVPSLTTPCLYSSMPHPAPPAFKASATQPGLHFSTLLHYFRVINISFSA